MSKEKKKTRENFRSSVFERDEHKCKVCACNKQPLDSHHITNREVMPSGGYVTTNGISLCADCHIKAEKFYETGTAVDGYSVEDLYKLIDSSYEQAFEDSLKL